MPVELYKLPRHANKLGIIPLQMYTYHVMGNSHQTCWAMFNINKLYLYSKVENLNEPTPSLYTIMTESLYG